MFSTDRLVAVGLAVVAGYGCGSSAGMDSRDAATIVEPGRARDAEPGASDLADAAVIAPIGLWVGVTSQDLPIRLSLDNGVWAVELGWAVPMCGSTTTITFGAPVPIVDGAFSQTIPGGPGGIRGRIDGMFVSDKLLTGTVSFMVVPIPGQPSCTGSESVTYSAAPG